MEANPFATVQDLGRFGFQRFGVPISGAMDGLAFRAANELVCNGWDAAGARAFGYRVAWVNRADAPTERLGFLPDLIVPDISALAALT